MGGEKNKFFCSGPEAANDLVLCSKRQGLYNIYATLVFLFLKVVAVEGNFDDCQRLVKGMFREEKLAEQLRFAASGRAMVPP